MQLNTSNKLGETPIKTAAMAGKVNIKFQTYHKILELRPTSTIIKMMREEGLFNLFQAVAVQKLLEAGAKADSLGKVTDPEVGSMLRMILH